MAVDGGQQTKMHTGQDENVQVVHHTNVQDQAIEQEDWREDEERTREKEKKRQRKRGEGAGGGKHIGNQGKERRGGENTGRKKVNMRQV